MFRELYSKAWFRVPLKFTFSFVVAKLIIDWCQYKLLYSQLKIPRTMFMFGAQNALSPPLPTPYPYADSYENLQSVYYKQPEKQHLFNDLPCRENPDSIDHFIEYGNINRIKEYINYTFINKLVNIIQKKKSQGISIPEGINQKIRELEQYKLQFHCPIVPVL